MLRKVGLPPRDVKRVWGTTNADEGVGRNTIRYIRRQGYQAVMVTRPITPELLREVNGDTDLAAQYVPGNGGTTVGHTVGVYFPNGAVDDPFFQVLALQQARTAGAALGNLLLGLAVRRAKGLESPKGARAALDIFQRRALKEEQPELAAIIQKQIPALPKSSGGQYPLGIEPPKKK